MSLNLGAFGSPGGRTVLTKGYHSNDLFESVRKAWLEDDHLLVVSPPLKNDFSFVDLLPGGVHEASFPEKPVFGVFTSGTVSGRPRLVLYSRKNIESALEAVLGLFDRSRITSVFAYPQPFHTFGLTLGYLLAIKLGVPIYFQEGKYGQTAHSKRASLTDPGLLTLGTPAHFFDLCGLIRKGLKISPSYSCIIGGAAVDVELWNEVREVALIEAPSIGYGCTEASPAITHLAPGVPPMISGEIGQPLANLSSRVLKGVGVEITGDSLCMAIVDDTKVIFPDKLTISDNVEVRETDGSWIFHGRLDLLINRGGTKIALEDVEEMLKNQLGLFAVAFAVSSARLGQDLAIAVRFPDEHFAAEHGLKPIGDREEIAALVLEKLSAHFALKLNRNQLLFLEQFPLSESAKVDRASITRLYLEREART